MKRSWWGSYLYQSSSLRPNRTYCEVYATQSPLIFSIECYSHQVPLIQAPSRRSLTTMNSGDSRGSICARTSFEYLLDIFDGHAVGRQRRLHQSDSRLLIRTAQRGVLGETRCAAMFGGWRRKCDHSSGIARSESYLPNHTINICTGFHTR